MTAPPEPIQFQVEVQAWRGRVIESVHQVEFAAVDREGRLHAGTSEPELVTTLRSAAKPGQLLALVERGHADRWGFRDEELAVMAASHTGSAYHRDLVKGILARIGLGPERLACGFHTPLDPAAQAELRADPALASPLHNNCSGKHAGMLALAVSEGWPPEGYEAADHPVQRLAGESVADLCGADPAGIVAGTDDCGVVVFALPLRSMARGYARLSTARPEGGGRERALARIRDAMRSWPGAVGGSGRFSTALMEATSGRILSKGGAEGLECVGLPALGLGVAIKCRDGSGRAVPPAVVAVLERLGAITGTERESLGAAARPVLRSHAGREVGRLEAVLRPAPRGAVAGSGLS